MAVGKLAAEEDADVIRELVSGHDLVFIVSALGGGTGTGSVTNTTLVVWGLWWPGMIVLAITFGRVWCTVCPMELVHRAGDALARRLGYRRARLSPWLRAGWLTLLLYLTLQLLVAGVSIHRIPHATAILLLALAFGVVVLTIIKTLSPGEPRPGHTVSA